MYSSSDFDDVPVIDATAVLGDDGLLTIFAVNRSIDSDILLTCDLRAFQKVKFEEQIILHHDDVKAVNTEQAPNTVVPIVRKDYKLEDGLINVKIPALSWNVLKLSTNVH